MKQTNKKNYVESLIRRTDLISRVSLGFLIVASIVSIACVIIVIGEYVGLCD